MPETLLTCAANVRPLSWVGYQVSLKVTFQLNPFPQSVQLESFSTVCPQANFKCIQVRVFTAVVAFEIFVIQFGLRITDRDVFSRICSVLWVMLLFNYIWLNVAVQLHTLALLLLCGCHCHDSDYSLTGGMQNKLIVTIWFSYSKIRFYF